MGSSQFSPAAKSILGFAVYMTLVGTVLVVMPNLLLTTVALPPTSEPWIRVLGMFMIVVSYYYYRAAVVEATEVFRATVWGRSAMAAFLAALALLRVSGPVLVLFGMAELTGALITAYFLRSSDRTVQTVAARQQTR